MNALSLSLNDSWTMLRRDFRHSLRNLPMTLSGIGTPVIMLALFNYFFGGALGAGLTGLGGGSGAHGSYINYIAPGVLLMAVAAGCETTAVNLVTDMSEGIITRFRTMAIARASVLAGTAFGSLLRTLLSIVLVLVVAVLMGFRPTTNPLAYLAALGVVALFTFGVTWMGIVCGLIGKTPAGANSLSLIFLLLAFTSSAFVPADSMSGPVRWYAEYQPFTPVINTVRGLLLGTPVSQQTFLLAIGWCVALTLVGFFWARAVYTHNAVR